MGGSKAALMAAAALLTLLATAGTSTISYDEETRRMFVEWKAKNGKTYKFVGEEDCRYAVFKNARRDVERARLAGITSSGLNGLADLTHEEISRGRGVRLGEASYEEETRRMFVWWKAKYGKTYRDVGEEECRYKLFKSNRRVVVELNAAAGETTYGLNQFGDLTKEEIRAACCYGLGVVWKNPEMEGELSARCQAAAAADLPNRYRELKPIWYQVCRCIATELKQSTESGGSTIPEDEAHMSI